MRGLPLVPIVYDGMFDEGEEAGEATPVGGASELVAALFTSKVLASGPGGLRFF